MFGGYKYSGIGDLGGLTGGGEETCKRSGLP